MRRPLDIGFTLPRVLQIMDAAEREARGQSRRRRGMSSITWGTRSLGRLGFVTAAGATADFNTAQINTGGSGSVSIQPFPNPDTLPGAWPGLTLGPISQEPPPPIFNTTIQANGLPGQVPVVVTPTSGPIPAPGTVAAATAAPASWFDQSLIAGIANKWLLLGGIGALFLFGGKK